MLATLRQRNFALLWTAGLISLTGNWMLSIALPVVVYQMTGSALAVGGLLLARSVPGILFSALGGVFVDRWERRRTIVVVNLLLALAILPLLMVRSPESLWLVYAVLFAQSTLGKFFAPAENAMLPLLSDPALLVSANALNALNNNLARLVGPALGGLIAATVGLEGVVFLDMLTYLAAAGLAALISVRSHPGKHAGGNAPSMAPATIVREWIEGVRLIWRERTLRTVFVAYIFPCISESVLYVLLVPFVTEVLRGDSLHVGGLMSAQAVGGIAGGVLISSIAPRFKPHRLLGLSAVGVGLADLVLFNYSSVLTGWWSGVALAYILLVVAGPLAVGLGSAYNTLIQTHVEDAYRGRVFATVGLIESLFALIGIAIAGFAVDQLGIVPVINLQAYAYLLMGLICLIALREGTARRLTVPAAP